MHIPCTNASHFSIASRIFGKLSPQVVSLFHLRTRGKVVDQSLRNVGANFQAAKFARNVRRRSCDVQGAMLAILSSAFLHFAPTAERSIPFKHWPAAGKSRGLRFS